MDKERWILRTVILQERNCHMRRLEKLRRHHALCEERYRKSSIEQANKERERTLHLHTLLNVVSDNAIDFNSTGAS